MRANYLWCLLAAFAGLLDSGIATETTDSSRKFPDSFIFGSTTASYQIEGAWNEDGKGENIWDHLTHNNPESIVDMSNGDIAADSYHNYKRDVEIVRELGLDAYRFSISWARILPTGTSDKINQPGIDHYNNLINEMLAYNITPFVTLYHWDLPQRLQEFGGWLNPYMADWFEDYARVLYENFGDRVKHWITFNEPQEICYEGYGTPSKAPQLNYTGVGEYICAKNLLIANARAWHLYDKEFRHTQNGQVGITLSIQWTDSYTDSEEDQIATELWRQMEWGIYAEPIFSRDGGFPRELVTRIAEKSAQQGYTRSRLPEMTKEEICLVRGSADFFGINHYTGYFVSATEGVSESPVVPSRQDDVNVGVIVPEDWLQSALSWLRLAPNSLYNLLTHLHSKYDNIEFYVTENGFASYAGFEDNDRITYLTSALEGALSALEDGIPLKGYMTWSLLDNFEWLAGYSVRFGMYEVNFNDTARTRTPRKSAFVYKQIIKTRMIDYSYEPDTMTMTIDE